MKTYLVGWALAAAAAVAAVPVVRAAGPATGPAGGTLSETDGAAEVVSSISAAGTATFRLKFAAGASAPSLNDVKSLIESLRWRPAQSDTVIRWRVTRYTPLGGEAVVACEQQVVGDTAGFWSYPTGVDPNGSARAAEALVTGLRERLASDDAAGTDVGRRVKGIDARLAEIRTMRGMLEAMVQSQPPRGEVMAARIKALRAEHERLEMTRSAKEARQHALEKALASERSKLDSRKEGDPIADELRGVLKLREEEVKHVEMMYNSGVATAVDLAEARAKLADVRIKTAEREAVVGRAGKGEILDRLADEMTMAAVDLTDVRLQLQTVDAELARLNPSTATTRSLEEAVRDGTVPAGGDAMPPLYGELAKEETALSRERLVLEVDGVELTK